MLASRVLESATKQRKVVRRKVCPHCDQNLNIITLKRHKTLFHLRDGTWIREVAPSVAPNTTEVETMIQPPELPSFEVQSSSVGEIEDTMLQTDSDSADSEYSDTDLEEIWDDVDDGDDEKELIDFTTDIAPSLPIFHTHSAELQNVNAIMMWVIRFLLSFQAKYYITDAAIDLLIKFLFIFVSVTGGFSTFMKELAAIFPRSLSTMLTLFKDVESFTKFVVCRRCHTLYNYANCYEKVGTHTKTKCCDTIPFPNHPHHSRREPCNCPLLKSVEVNSGRKILYPYKIYCYTSLKSALKKLFLRPSFYEQCQQWKTRSNSSNDSLDDVYDGAIWKEFQSSFPNSFAVGLMLNVDWFQPYTRTISSVGVIYLTLMNLSRRIRSKRENIILLGVIPGPNEPSHDINSYLIPLVEELLSLWEGITIEIAMPSGIKKQTLRCALLCVSCDLPAVRKTCGFLSHSAALGCSKCLKKFSGSVGTMNYSGFDCSTWQKRTSTAHRESVKKINRCDSKSTQLKMESQLGCRHTVLLDLPYFDPVRMHVIDPMHNLFLGSGKHMIGIWQRESLILPSHYEKLQKFVDSLSVPSDVGRIPQKIESGFGGFKADQFKNWINIYSIPALADILPTPSLECWRHFVLACRILCKHNLSTHDIDLAHALLLQFCRKVQDLYGESSVTPNMHMHAHLKEVILDYGPLQEFWCFSFERFNGILGKQPSNNRSIEPQLMKRFLRDNLSSSNDYPELFQNEFGHIMSTCIANKFVGSNLESSDTDDFTLCSKHTRAMLSSDAICALRSLLSKLNTSISESAVIDINSIFMKFASITLKGRVYCSSGTKAKPVVAMALWDESIYGLPPTPLPGPPQRNANIRPVNIHYYAKIIYTVGDCTTHDVLALVSWFCPHPQQHALGKPAELWCNSIFEPVDFSCSYMPLKNIVCRCAHGIKLHQEEHLVVVPLVE